MSVDGQDDQVTDKTFTLEVQKGWKSGTKVVYQGEGDKRPNMKAGMCTESFLFEPIL